MVKLRMHILVHHREESSDDIKLHVRDCTKEEENYKAIMAMIDTTPPTPRAYLTAGTA